MKGREIEEFRDAATKYCDLIDSLHSFNEAKGIHSLLVVLSTLYVKALVLPDIDFEDGEPIELTFPEPIIEFGERDGYSMIFNPSRTKSR